MSAVSEASETLAEQGPVFEEEEITEIQMRDDATNGDDDGDDEYEVLEDVVDLLTNIRDVLASMACALDKQNKILYKLTVVAEKMASPTAK